jgi:tetratricopeptide (TPR) repeat protein
MQRSVAWLLVAAALPAAVLAADAPKRSYMSSADAEKSLASGDLDSVYLAFGAIKPGRHPEGDTKIAAVLVHGATLAAAQQDWVLSVGFAAKARELDPTNVDGCLAEADAAVHVNHKGEAEEALDAAVKAAPTHWAIVLRLAQFARDESELDKAHELVLRIPDNVPESTAARKLSADIDAAIVTVTSAPPPPSAAARPGSKPGRTPNPPRESVPSVKTTASDEAIPGYAARASEHFRITYSEGQRDFAQKAGYEQQCLDLLERAYAKVQAALGVTTDTPTDVVLYTKQEFALHFGGRLENNVLGFYAGKIRMNRADTIDDTFFDTAVHEYTHAVIDSLSHHNRVPFWVHEGLARWVERTSAGRDPAEGRERSWLKMAQSQGRMPTLAQMSDRGLLDLGTAQMVAVGYAKSALAIDGVIRSGTGLIGLERSIRGATREKRFEEAFAEEFGASRLGLLDGEVGKLFE